MCLVEIRSGVVGLRRCVLDQAQKRFGRRVSC